jgi:hypothetical protein
VPGFPANENPRGLEHGSLEEQRDRLASEAVAQFQAINRADPQSHPQWDAERAALIDRLHSLDHRLEARALLHHWLLLYRDRLASAPCRHEAQREHLWRCLADVVERTADQTLLELFWSSLSHLSPQPFEADPQAAEAPLPLLGVPILNRFDLLERLLLSLDHPVHTLAIVDNSGGRGEGRSQLDRLVARGHPLIEHICVATPFRNMGVAGSWNLILRSFPEAAVVLLANNDVQLSRGGLRSALSALHWNTPCFLPMLPGAARFSAFLLTAGAWDLLGFFDENFYPAYCEDADYLERIAAQPLVQTIELAPLQQAMAACNPAGSATIASDPRLATHNRVSFQLNRLWLLSKRRYLGDHRGSWIRRWLCQWAD